ncbi:hypothetical protein [Pseudomonas aeruginosa]|uniref:hypothetical protein n=1 Tax=Pseudomonas aeruginosa TaxID=287 RepID=UPI001298E3E4|nr:hypothetical protein [Pseudomonas aeruginosa]
METTSPHFDYDQYAATKYELRKLIQEDFVEAIAHGEKCDHLILSSTRELGAGEALAAAVHAHSLYLAAYDLARAGHFSAMFPLLRTALESAVYGYLFNREEGLIDKWRKRHVSDEDFNNCKQAFTRAMTRFRGYLQEHDKKPGDTPYEEYVMSLYDAAIDFGAHPNPIALVNNTSVIAEGTQSKFTYQYLRTEKKGIAQGFVACFEFATVIAVVNHLSRMQINPELPGLDVTFLDFFRETNAVSDKLNGQPIGFDNRYYNRVNSLVSPKKDD